MTPTKPDATASLLPMRNSPASPKAIRCSSTRRMELRESAASAFHSLTRFLRRHWNTFNERHERARVRATLYRMTDRELKDLGLTRSEIESVMVDGSGELIRAYPDRV